MARQDLLTVATHGQFQDRSNDNFIELYNLSNSVSNQANAAFNQANTAAATANTVLTQANAAFDRANLAFNQANTAYTQANNAFNTANSAYTQANTARTHANNAYNHANAAFNAANAAAGGGVTFPITIAQGGTGQITAQAALNAIGNVTSIILGAPGFYNAVSLNSIAIGTGSRTGESYGGDRIICLGVNTNAAGSNCIAIGTGARTYGVAGSISIGHSTNGVAECVVIGGNAVGSGVRGIVLGSDSRGGTDAVVIGSMANGNGITIGYSANNIGSGVLIGRGAIGWSGVAIGNGVFGGNLSAATGVTIGTSANNPANGVVIGLQAITLTRDVVVIGATAKAGIGISAFDGTVVGHNSAINGSNQTALGANAKCDGGTSVAIGAYSNTGSALGGVALGFQANALGTNTVALGRQANALATEANLMQLGNATTLATLRCRVALTVSSDIRDKTDILPVAHSLNFINNIEPIQYVLNHRQDYKDDIDDIMIEEIIQKIEAIESEGKKVSQDTKISQIAPITVKEDEEVSEEKALVLTKINNLTIRDIKDKWKAIQLERQYGIADYDREAHKLGTKKGARKRAGVSAQQVQEILQDIYGTDNYADIVSSNLYDVENIPEGVEDLLTINYSGFVPFLIGAIKELTERVRILEGKL